MNRIVYAATAAAFIVTLSTGAQATPASSLGDCYNHVISACNKKTNTDAAHACANSGMNACDKVHSGKNAASTVPPGTIQRLRANVLAEVVRQAPARTR